MEDLKKAVLKAKEQGNTALVQRLQQELDELEKIRQNLNWEKLIRELEDVKEVNTALFGIIVRLNDKINRLINLSTNHDMKAKNEPIDDAFLDIAVYAVMAMIVKQNKWGK